MDAASCTFVGKFPFFKMYFLCIFDTTEGYYAKSMPDDYLENTNTFSVNATFNNIYLENLLGTD